MRIRLHSAQRIRSPKKCQSPGDVSIGTRRSEGGFAVVVIIILLAIMTAMAIGNNVALAHLRGELQLVDKRQQRRYRNEKTTNAPANRAAAPKSEPASTPGSPTRPPVK